MLLRVTASPRIHFGLMQIDRTKANCFSGLGLMLEQPALVISLSAADTFSVQADETAVADRVRSAAETTSSSLKLSELPPVCLKIETTPQLHTGLGTGTQLACSTATAIAAYCWQRAESASTPVQMSALDVWKKLCGHSVDAQAALSNAAGRGKRSHIGISGFLHGGWILDPGQPIFTAPSTQTTAEDTSHSSSRPTIRLNFPASWSVLLFKWDEQQGLSGKSEQATFDRAEKHHSDIPERMSKLAYDTITHSLTTQNFQAFAHAIADYNALAGELFNIPGEPQTNHQTAARFRHKMQQLGFKAIGQSSWGPTMWAITDRSDMTLCEATEISAALHQAGLPDCKVDIVKPQHSGAQVSFTSDIASNC